MPDTAQAQVTLAQVPATIAQVPATIAQVQMTDGIRYDDARRCPCGSANFCSGPRGGRYCINKYGKKKYFKSLKNKP